MNKHFISPRFLIPCLMLAMAASFAATTAYADDDREEAELARFSIEQSGINAGVALARVAKQYPGIIYKYELDEEEDRLVHEVKVINVEEGRKYKIKVDVTTGEFVSETSKLMWNWFREDDDVGAAKQLEATGFTLMQAIAVLDKVIPMGGERLLMEAELENKQGIHYFELETYENNGEKKWLIDISSQQLIPAFKR